MYGNDFIIFKHGCGDDSEYTMAKNEYDGKDDRYKFSEESKTKMKKHCENHIFYHVEVEPIGKNTNTHIQNTFEYEESDDGPPTTIGLPGSESTDSKSDAELHPEDDEINPKVFKIKRATLLDVDFTANGKEEIWFDKPQEIILNKGAAASNNQMMLKFFQFHRDDLKRKTTILRKVNPSDCNFMPIGNQNIFLHWGIFVENFNSSMLKTLNETDDEVIIRRSHLYSEKIEPNGGMGQDASEKSKKRIGFGHRQIHLIDFHDVPDSKF